MAAPAGSTEPEPVGDLVERVERIARQLGAMTGPLDRDELAPVEQLDRVLSMPDPGEVAIELYRLVLGRPPELGSSAAELLAAGGSAVDLALDLVESEEATHRDHPHRPALVRELRLRSLRAAWSLPPRGPLGALLRDPGSALALATLRITGGPDDLATALDRLRVHGDRDRFLRAEWRSSVYRRHGGRTSLRGLASRARHHPVAFRVFRSHVLAVEPAAIGLLTALALHEETGVDDASQRRTARATAARVDEIAAGVRLLLQDRSW